MDVVRWSGSPVAIQCHEEDAERGYVEDYEEHRDEEAEDLDGPARWWGKEEIVITRLLRIVTRSIKPSSSVDSPDDRELLGVEAVADPYAEKERKEEHCADRVKDADVECITLFIVFAV